MAGQNKTYSCPSCGGDLRWSPSAHKLICPFCGSAFAAETFSQQDQQTAADLDQQNYPKGEEASAMGYTSAQDATDDTAIDPADLRTYSCSSCGAQIVTDKTTVATACAFCGSPVVLTEQLDTTFRPKWIIPFKIDRAQMESIYWDYVKSRPFTPGAFRARSQIEKIKSIYLPFWLYNMDMKGSLTAKGERTMTSADSHFIYTTHQVYDIQRAGTLTLAKVPVDASSRSPDDAMDSIEPYDLSELQPFSMGYLAGYLAERYDQDEKTCYERAARRAGQTMANILNQSVAGFEAVQITSRQVNEVRSSGLLGSAGAEQTALASGVRAEYALLPVYLLFTKYKGQDYLFAVNGQTGKAVGDVPSSAGRQLSFFLAVFLIMTAVLFLVARFFLFA